ncbi:MAG: glycosyltransferase [Pedobacter sp.]|nr:MAG: glycosyltransferase [Pedobacter sp.]
MRVILYNVNSFGGNFEYALMLHLEYSRHPLVEKVTLVMPENAGSSAGSATRFLMTDKPAFKNKYLRKLHFVYRSFINPLRFYRFLKTAEPSVVIFNDFEQLSAIWWSTLFLKLKAKHKFGVILHDPDRDRYFANTWLSRYTMKKVMRIMDVAIYHGYLPNRSYYNNKAIKLKVPHGIYPPGTYDKEFATQLKSASSGRTVLGVIGNIRREKNYDVIISALPQLPSFQLLVAGSRSNSSVDTADYLELIREHDLHDRVTWKEKYLTDGELNAAIETCDIILLYYNASFVSQSGILNKIAPYRKKVIVSDSSSSLNQAVVEFGLGIIVPESNVAALAEGIKRLVLTDQEKINRGWGRYIATASWERNVALTLSAFNNIPMPGIR